MDDINEKTDFGKIKISCEIGEFEEVELSDFLRDIIASSGDTSDLKLLPISQVFFRLAIKEDNWDRGIIFFDLSCEIDAVMPSSLHLEIMDGKNKVFSRKVSIKPLNNRKKYSARNMYQTEHLLLNREELLGISYGTETLVIFSDGDYFREFPLFIPWHHTKRR